MVGKNMGDPWLSFIGPIIAALIIATATVYSVRFGVEIFTLEQEEKRKNEILQERKIALFNALHVIDLVYANLSWDSQPPLNPTEWDVQLARDSMNKMLIYCKNPKETVEAFSKAIGLYNPSVENPVGAQVKYLDEFRKSLALELDLPAFEASNPEYTWIASLPGTREAKKLEIGKIPGKK